MQLKKHIQNLALVTSLLLGSTAGAEITGQQRAEAAGHDLLGTPAPRLVVKTIDGDSIDLGSLYGKKAVYLKFWATWCVPCRQQMPHFQHIYETAGPDLAVIAINVGFNDSVEAIRKYQKQLGITMPIVFDGDAALAVAFNVRVTPQHIVIGRDGRIQYVGHLADERLDAALIAARAPGTDAAHGAAAARQALAQTYRTGDSLPKASVRTLDGREFHFQQQGLAGPTVFVFLSPWCESYLETSRPQVSANCRAAREQVNSLSRNPHVRWLGVASGLWATSEDLQDYQKKYAIGIPLSLDESGKMFREFGVNNTPVMIVADAKGTIIQRIETDKSQTLQQVLQGL
jgi:peroxiredoxin